MKNIFTIFTGGTICTHIKKGVMTPGTDASYAICDYFENSGLYFTDEIRLCKGKCFNILSENMSVSVWNEIIEYIRKELSSSKKYDGMVILHGTDTLAFSTALFSALLKGISLPVFFVSANAPICLENGDKNPLSNGCDNFASAIECIYKGIAPGVYATYKNPEDNKMYLHKGENLLQCRIYDENFYSRDMLDISDLSCAVLPSHNDSSDFEPLIKILPENPLSECILKINPYPGMRYDFFSLENVKAVYHSTYHSGTACVQGAENSLIYFMDKCYEKNIPFYFSPSLLPGENTVYESVPHITKHPSYGKSAHILHGPGEEYLYALLLIYYSAFEGEISFLSFTAPFFPSTEHKSSEKTFQEICTHN